MFLASSTFGAYYFFAFSALFCTLMCAVFMFETKGHSLEFIEQKYSERQASGKSKPWNFSSNDLMLHRIVTNQG